MTNKETYQQILERVKRDSIHENQPMYRVTIPHDPTEISLGIEGKCLQPLQNKKNLSENLSKNNS